MKHTHQCEQTHCKDKTCAWNEFYYIKTSKNHSWPSFCLLQNPYVEQNPLIFLISQSYDVKYFHTWNGFYNINFQVFLCSNVRGTKLCDFSNFMKLSYTVDLCVECFLCYDFLVVMYLEQKHTTNNSA